MKIMFWNVQGLSQKPKDQKRRRDFRTIIHHYSPDILCTCESYENITFHTHQTLIKSYDEYQVYGKKELRDPTPLAEIQPFDRDPTERSFVKLTFDNTIIGLCHLDSYSSLIRIEQLRILSNIPNIQVIMGDLNFSYSSSTSRLLGRIFVRIKSCTSEKEYQILSPDWYSPRIKPTFPTKRPVRGVFYRWPVPFLHLDQIWYRDCNPNVIERVDHGLIHLVSDHYPIMLTL